MKYHHKHYMGQLWASSWKCS